MAAGRFAPDHLEMRPGTASLPPISVNEDTGQLVDELAPARTIRWSDPKPHRAYRLSVSLWKSQLELCCPASTKPDDPSTAEAVKTASELR
jgi:hypothetical protein